MGWEKWLIIVLACLVAKCLSSCSRQNEDAQRNNYPYSGNKDTSGECDDVAQNVQMENPGIYKASYGVENEDRTVYPKLKLPLYYDEIGRPFVSYGLTPKDPTAKVGHSGFKMRYRVRSKGRHHKGQVINLEDTSENFRRVWDVALQLYPQLRNFNIKTPDYGLRSKLIQKKKAKKQKAKITTAKTGVKLPVPSYSYNVLPSATPSNQSKIVQNFASSENPLTSFNFTIQGGKDSQKIYNYIVELLEMFGQPHVDKNRVRMILEAIESSDIKVPLQLLILLEGEFKNILTYLYPNDAEWKELQLILEGLKNTHVLPSDDVKEDKDLKTIHDEIVEVLHLLHTPDTDKSKIVEILEGLMKSSYLVPTKLINVWELAVKRNLELSPFGDTAGKKEWENILQILDQLKKTHGTTDGQDGKSANPIHYDTTEEDFKNVLDYIKELQRQVRVLEPDVFKVIEIFTALLKSNFKLSAKLVYILELIVDFSLHEATVKEEVIAWKKAAVLLEELRRTHLLPHIIDDDVPYINELVDFNFTIVINGPGSEKIREEIITLLNLLKNPKPEAKPIHKILVSLQYSNFKLPLKLIFITELVVKYNLNFGDISQGPEWNLVLKILENIKKDSDKEVITDQWGIKVIINEVLNFEFPTPNPKNEKERQLVLEVLNLLMSLKPDLVRIHELLASVKTKIGLQPVLLSMLLRAVNSRISQINISKDVKWTQILVILEELQKSVDTKISPDKWGIHIDLNEVINFKFPSEDPENEIQRQYLIEILNILRSSKPDKDQIYEFLVAIKNNVNLHPTLLSILVKSINNRLSQIDTSKKNKWSKILVVVKELQMANNSESKKVKSDQWGIHIELNDVINFKFPSADPENEKQRKYVIEVLNILKSQKPDKKQIYELLITMKKDINFDPTLVSILESAVNKRLSEVDSSKDALWSKILVVLKEFQKPDVNSPGNRHSLDKIDLMSVLNFNLPTLPDPDHERQRKYILNVLNFLKSPIPDTTQIYKLLIALKGEVKLHPVLLDVLTRAINDRLSYIHPTKHSQWTQILNILNSLQEPDLKPDVVPDKWGVLADLNLVLNFKFPPGTADPSNQKQRAYVLEVLRLLNRDSPEKNRIYNILLSLKNDFTLDPTLWDILTRAFKNRFPHIDTTNDAYLRDILVILEKQNKPNDWDQDHFDDFTPDKWGIHIDYDQVLNYKFPTQGTPDNEKQRKYVIEVLQLLKNPIPSKKKIYNILLSLKNEVTLDPSLLLILNSAFNKRFASIDQSKDTQWRDILLILEELKEPINSNEDDSDEEYHDKWGIQINYNEVVNFKFPTPHDKSNKKQREYVLEVLKLLKNPKPNTNEIFQVLTTIKDQEVRLHPTLLLILTRALNNRLLNVNKSDPQWRKILLIFDEIKDFHDSSFSPDKWGIHAIANQVLNFKFPSSNPDNDIQRQYIIAVLRLLTTQKPDRERIYNLLVLLNRTKLHPSLLLMLKNAVKSRLSDMDVFDLSEWKKIFEAIDEHEVPDITPDNDGPDNKPDETPSFNSDIKFVQKYIFSSPGNPNNEKVRSHILELLRLLEARKPDKEGIFGILLSLKTYAIPPTLLQILTQALKRKFKGGNKLKDPLLRNILLVLDQLQNPYEPNDHDSEEVEADEWGIYVDIETVENFKFPSSSPDNDKQRHYVIQLLHLLQSRSPNKRRIYDILVSLSDEVTLHPNLLLILTRAFNNRLLRISPKDPQWKNILLVLDELKKSQKPQEKDDDDSTSGFIVFKNKVLDGNPGVVKETLSYEVFLYLKHLYIALTSPKPDKARIKLILDTLKRYKLKIEYNILLEYGYDPDSESSDVTTEESDDTEQKSVLYNNIALLLQQYLKNANKSDRSNISNLLFMLQDNYKTLNLVTLSALYRKLVSDPIRIKWSILLKDFKESIETTDPQKLRIKYVYLLSNLLKKRYSIAFGEQKYLILDILKMIEENNSMPTFKMKLIYEYLMNTEDPDWNHVLYIIRQLDYDPSTDSDALKTQYYEILVKQLKEYYRESGSVDKQNIERILYWLEINRNTLRSHHLKKLIEYFRVQYQNSRNETGGFLFNWGTIVGGIKGFLSDIGIWNGHDAKNSNKIDLFKYLDFGIPLPKVFKITRRGHRKLQYDDDK